MWLRAREQTAGRGRQGRDWASASGNLFASGMFALQPGDPPAPTLALVAAVALHDSMRRALPADAATKLQLKWPNDVLIDGAKLSGILLERTGDWIVLGIGVNVASHPELADRATTSLHALGATIDAEAFLETLAERVADGIRHWREHGIPAVTAIWLSHAHPAGTWLSVHLPDGERIEGAFETLDRDGALVLRLASGAARVIHAGDVFLI